MYVIVLKIIKLEPLTIIIKVSYIISLLNDLKNIFVFIYKISNSKIHLIFISDKSNHNLYSRCDTMNEQ